MSLIDRMETELKTAMLEQDNERRDALRLILASLRSAEKELQRPLSDDEELQVLQRGRRALAWAAARAKAASRGARGIPQRRARGAGGEGGARAGSARRVHAA